ncbi:hypothetical protein LWI29_027896 [Acer saccharum]|uniref:Uncharacterized protein n=1 Tax=Acer saccharum TaxID=4024 RepID=A0AA39RF46_ACESA|nr:hypothetical protein LWI29_027896 [Acer saccharum]
MENLGKSFHVMENLSMSCNLGIWEDHGISFHVMENLGKSFHVMECHVMVRSWNVMVRSWNVMVSLHAFSYADWAANKDDFSSTSAYIVYLGRNPISWTSKKQNTIARSSMEAEYRSIATTAAELNWFGSLCWAHVSSSDQFADALTKPLSRPLFQSLKDKIGLSCCGLS